MALTLILNGTLRRFETLLPGASLASLVEALELKSDRIALEHNGEIAPRNDWNKLQLFENDKIELVHFVGGGVDTEANA